MMLQSDVGHCCVIHNCEVKSKRIGQQAVQTEQPSDEIRRADRVWALAERAESELRPGLLSFWLVESFVCGLQVRSFSVGASCVFQALGSDSEESKKVNVEEDVDQAITDDSGSD